jgi:hypothetical protein
MGQVADFFVSRASGDRIWAAIPWQLEAEGHEIVVRAWDFTVGHDRPYETQQTTAIAARLVLIPSTACLRSASGLAEWRIFDARAQRPPTQGVDCMQHPIAGRSRRSL